ncbi:MULTISPECIES: hypothetical protein [Streptomyces]|uniref:Uncharacterized protein n=2 Tax=Streptomyces TaxID=1883 RepID=A0ABV9IUS3_9ACTN
MTTQTIREPWGLSVFGAGSVRDLVPGMVEVQAGVVLGFSLEH